MKKLLLIAVVGMVFCVGCQDVWESTTAGQRQQAVRSQRLAQEKFLELYAAAEEEGNHELCLKILESYAQSLPQYRNLPISSSVVDNGEAWHERQMRWHQDLIREHKASFDRMQRGGLP